MFKENEASGKSHLIKYLSPMGAWALAFGCSVGWGAFVMPGTTFLPLAGPVGTLLGMVIGGFVMLLIGVNYHFLMNRYPDSGGTYAFTKNEFGYDQGFMSAWFLILVYMAIAWANATAIPIICRKLFPGLLEVGPCYQVAGFDVYLLEAGVASLAILISSLICLQGGKVLSVIQTVLAIVLIGGIVICAIYIFMYKGHRFINPQPAFADNGGSLMQVFRIVALAPWAYVGFESISHSTEEFSFSVKKSLQVFIAALMAGVVAYSALAYIAVSAIPAGSNDWKRYVQTLDSYSGISGLPTFNAVLTYMGTMGVRILGIAVLAGVMTGLIGNLLACSRLVYILSRENIFYKYFKAINVKHVPFRAIVGITLVSLPIPFFGRTAISWIVDVTTIGATIAYMYTSISAYKRAKKEENSFVKFTGMVGFILSILFTLYFLIPNLWSVEALSSASYLILILWCILGFAIFYYVLKRDKEHRYGRSTVVWLVLLFLLLFLSMLWFRETSRDSAEDILDDVSRNSAEVLQDHKVMLSDDEWLSAREFLRNKKDELNNSMLYNSVVQMGIIMIALVVMFQIYHSMHEREHELEIDKTRAEENSRAKSVFLSNMSHDIRTPMNAILGYTELTKDVANLPEEAKENLEKIDYSGKQLLSLINDILDMSRIENGKMELEPEPTDLKHTFEAVKTIFAPQMKSKKLKFTVDAEKITDRYVMCDENRLNRVLHNLISNAFKFTPEEGSILVKLEQKGKENGLGRYELRVKDSGVGMSPEFAKTVFDAYTREKTASKVQGTGLGMAITKSIVELMNGSIDVVSQKGEGSEFIIDFSLEIIDEAKYAETHRFEDSYEKLDYSKVRILLVDDVMVNREIACKMLGKFGFMVDKAENGQEAVEKVKNSAPGTYKIVLMDIQMPVMDGYEATKAIRELEDPQLSATPIVAMSANAFAEDVQKSLENGMNGHIAKPIEIDKMMETIDEILELEGEVITKKTDEG